MRKIYRVDGATQHPSKLAIDDVAAELERGALALLPTETVYGVGVAVAAFAHAEGHRVNGAGLFDTAQMPPAGSGYCRIFSLKQRELTQTVPWLVSGPEALDEFGRGVDPRARALTEAFWPGALTIVVKASEAVPAFMQAADGTVALRASASPVIGGLIAACGSPLAVTSANTHGAPAPDAFGAVEPRILNGVDVAVDAGATVCHDASTIVSFATGQLQVLRQGALSACDIEEVLSAYSQSTENRASSSLDND